MTRDLRSVRSRPRSEGAAFVEALIIIGVFVVCMQCVWAMYRLGFDKQAVLVDARHQAWLHALEGCGEAGMKAAAESLSSPGASPNTNQVAGLSQKPSDQPPGWFAVQDASGGGAQRDVSIPIFGISEVRSSLKFACNEKGGEGELKILEPLAKRVFEHAVK